MEIDKETKLSSLNIVIDDNEKYLDKLRNQAKEDGQNDKEKKLSVTLFGHTNETYEIYIEDGKLFYSGNLSSKDGETYVSFELPISQTILFDILGEALKKFNKVRTLLEAVK